MTPITVYSVVVLPDGRNGDLRDKDDASIDGRLGTLVAQVPLRHRARAVLQ